MSKLPVMARYRRDRLGRWQTIMLRVGIFNKAGLTLTLWCPRRRSATIRGQAPRL